MASPKSRYYLYSIVCIQFAAFAHFVRAGDNGDEFSNNLFSDLAPLLALFGEQVAKQYLSQSISWLDSIIFAMAPLGIITAIVSAIRVGGPRWLRAIIGRARESKGGAELELMSSTSADVCELWDGETIVRTLGSPYIAELLWLEKIDRDEYTGQYFHEEGGTDEHDVLLSPREWDANHPSASLGQVFSRVDAQKAGFLKGADAADGIFESSTVIQLFRDQIFELEADSTPLNDLPTMATREHDRQTETYVSDNQISPPNLSLNISVNPPSTAELVLVAVISTILQTGVVLFQVIITYLRPFNRKFLKGEKPVPVYACPLTVAGTVMVVFGMFVCSMVVQKKSKEKTWYFNNEKIPSGYRLRVAWLQRHQVVTDQNFGGFCLYAPLNRAKIMSSAFRSHFKSQNLWTSIGTAISVVGFVVQFTGLRGMHYSATLAQLSAILIVSLLRIMIRRQIGTRPILETVPDGRELDWMAKKITSNSKWAVVPFNPSDPPKAGYSDTLIARQKLRQICPWPLENSIFASKAEPLSRAIEELTNYIHFHSASSIRLQDDLRSQSSFSFSVPIAYSKTYSGLQGSTRKSIDVEVHRKTTTGARTETWGGWTVDRYLLEAILTLWEVSITEDDEPPDTGYNDRSQSLILLGPSSEFNLLDFDLFIGSSSKCLRMKNGMKDLETIRFPISKHRVFGYIGTDREEEHLGLISSAHISDLCARHILICYFYRVCQFIDSLNGQTMAFHGYDAAATDPVFRMNNSHLDGMVDTLYTAGIHGSREELLILLVPALQKNGNLLRILDAFSKLIQDAHEAESNGLQPVFSQENLFRMTEQALKRFRNHGHWLHAGDFIFGLLGTCQRILGEDHLWTKTARSLVSRVCNSIEAQIICQLEFHNEFRSHALSRICSNLVLQCQTVLGKDSPEWATLSRLDLKVKLGESLETFGMTTGTARQDQFIYELPAHAPFNTTGTANHAADVLQPNISGRYTDNQNVISIIRLLKPGLDISFIKYLSADIWTLIKVQNLKVLHGKLCPSDSSPHAPVNSSLISDTFIIAAACGFARVVELCLRKYPSIYDYSNVGVGSSISKAALFATMNDDITILDLIVSSLDRDQMVLLEGLGSSDLNCLQIACRDGNVDIAHLLLRAGLNPISIPDTQNFESLPIFLAARGNHTEIISLLLGYGILLNYQDPKEGKTFVHYAALHNSWKTIDFVLAPDSNLLQLLFIEDYNGQIPLHVAIIGGNRSLALRLLEIMMVQTDQSDSFYDHQYTIFLACKHNHPEIVKLLLSKGFNPGVVDKSGFSAFEIAIIQNDYDVGRVLLEGNSALAVHECASGQWPIHLAVRFGSLNYLKLFLEHGASANTVEHETGLTPLLVSMGLGNLEIFELLITKNANINARNQKGRNLLHIAATADSGYLLEALFKRLRCSSTPLLHEVDDEKRTALELALIHGNFETARILLAEMQLCLDHTKFLVTAEGSSILHLISTLLIFNVDHRGMLSLKIFLKRYVKDMDDLPEPPVREIEGFYKPLDRDWAHREEMAIRLIEDLLKENVVSGKELDKKGRMPLFYAAAAGSVRICKLLLEFMDTTIDKAQIQSALYVALYGANTPVIKQIVSSGVDINEPLKRFLPNPVSLLLRIAAVTRGKESNRPTVLFHEDLEEEPWESDGNLLACLQVFIDAGADLTPTAEELAEERTLFHFAVMCKSPDIIDALAHAGADINLPGAAGRPLLHFALSFELPNQSLILGICRHGFDINSLDTRGRTALAIEIEKENTVTINALLDNGALLNPRGPKQDLLIATKSGDAAFLLFKLLCERYRQPPRTNNEYFTFLNDPVGPDGCRAVHFAARYHHEDILKFLHDEGADMHAKDGLGRNAIFYAFERTSTMRVLVEDYGIDPNERDSMGYTAAHLAITSLHNAEMVIRVLTDLIFLGADPNLKDSNGRLPFDHINAAGSTTHWMGNPDLRERVRKLFE